MLRPVTPPVDRGTSAASSAPSRRLSPSTSGVIWPPAGFVDTEIGCFLKPGVAYVRARPRRRGLPKDDGQRSTIAPNALDRESHAEQPNQRWIADFTYVWTEEGWLYVAAVIDLFSRRLVGGSMKPEMTAQFVTDALIMVIWRRGKPDARLHHSDQGSQYTSEQLQKLMADNGVTCSMSRSGNVWDNAAMESLFSSLKNRTDQGQGLPHA